MEWWCCNQHVNAVNVYECAGQPSQMVSDRLELVVFDSASSTNPQLLTLDCRILHDICAGLKLVKICPDPSWPILYKIYLSYQRPLCDTPQATYKGVQ